MVAVLRALAGSGFLIASTVLAQAAEPIHLRVADSFPKGHYLVKLVLEPWMEEVKKRTNNAVAFDHYPAQQLGKATDMLKLTQTGVADIVTSLLGTLRTRCRFPKWRCCRGLSNIPARVPSPTGSWRGTV